MPCYIQIGDDPAKWWLAEPFQASQLTGQPLTVVSLAPIGGTLILSPRSASVAVFNVPTGTPPPALGTPGALIYLPTLTGPSAGHVGYELAAGTDPDSLASQIAASMHSGQRQTIALGGAGGTLVLNGATLPFAITSPTAMGGTMPRD
ncbi:MAG: hypothetical protein ACRDOA_06570 [Streptosporangiaceae bacterium]